MTLRGVLVALAALPAMAEVQSPDAVSPCLGVSTTANTSLSAVTVVTGVSLPVLLHYVLHGDVPPRQAAEDAVARAIPALKVVARSPRGD